MTDATKLSTTVRLELDGVERDVEFDEVRLAANTDKHIVIAFVNEKDERISIVLPKKTLKELVNWRTALSL